jgi:hypothetical protein
VAGGDACLVSGPAPRFLPDFPEIYFPLCDSQPRVAARYILWTFDEWRPAFVLTEDREVLRLVSAGLDTSIVRPSLINRIYDFVVSGRAHWGASDVPALQVVADRFSKSYGEKEAAVIAAIARGIQQESHPRFEVLFGAVYLLIWLVALAIYPYSRWVQAVVFWHPRIRRVFFLFNPLLTAFAPLRRRMLRPFGSSLRSESSSDLAVDRFLGNRIIESGVQKTLEGAFPELAGHVVLEGRSGFGKTLYLRQLAYTSRDPVAYVEAKLCGSGVVAAIQERLPGWLNNEDFLQHLIYQGALTVIIDGLSEVGPDIRHAILSFMHRAGGAAIAIGTQPMQLPWPKNVRRLEIQPFTLEQSLGFLSHQGVPEQTARLFLNGLTDPGQDRFDREANELILGNPFDLTVISEMLLDGEQPDVQHLQAQQYRRMADLFRVRQGRDFPLRSFSERVYDDVVHDRYSLDAVTYSHELEVMAEMKMVLRRQSGSGAVEFVFRHDRVRDYFLVEAIRRENRIHQHFSDPRFRSSYLSLAMLLPTSDAIALREGLSDYAAETGDHLLADEVRRMLRVKPVRSSDVSAG